ncbi:hypothetical protein GCM10022232_92490 [Streptomyces plumbiresistens]|uniref:Uncharacterized protein n=2 Tax=Streptomyces plumbiresistens TaxID=511811 RepID=A0ABP7TWF8_9ACTN
MHRPVSLPPSSKDSGIDEFAERFALRTKKTWAPTPTKPGNRPVVGGDERWRNAGQASRPGRRQPRHPIRLRRERSSDLPRGGPVRDRQSAGRPPPPVHPHMDTSPELAITMMVGPQIMSAIIFVTTSRAVRVSSAFLLGVAVGTAVGVAIACGLAALLGSAV